MSDDPIPPVAVYIVNGWPHLTRDDAIKAGWMDRSGEWLLKSCVVFHAHDGSEGPCDER